MALGPAVEKEVKGRKVMDKISPQLRVNRGGGPEELELDAGIGKSPGVQIFIGGGLGQVVRCAHLAANLYQKVVPSTGCTQIGLQYQWRVNSQMSF